jgi:hypothetical protein
VGILLVQAVLMRVVEVGEHLGDLRVAHLVLNGRCDRSRSFGSHWRLVALVEHPGEIHRYLPPSRLCHGENFSAHRAFKGDMAYRDVSESLRAYRERISRDLEDARIAAKEVQERADKVRVLEKELAETDGLIAKLTQKRRQKLPVLENVAIAAPCKASWDAMVGDARVRFCGQCEKNVYNLSAMPRDEAEALLAAREGKMCVRLYKREDGTVMTSDCPVGVKRRRRRRAVAGVLGGGMMAATAPLFASSAGHAQGSPVPTGIPEVQGSAVILQERPGADDGEGPEPHRHGSVDDRCCARHGQTGRSAAQADAEDGAPRDQVTVASGVR